ncbi:MAG TPA: prolyl oligopeptidase family serine peptidase [Terracidiphilus sp.]|nr:prolyl oligopeptidase family serine peptidase [Terracidiphilus sp.]
MLRRFAGSLTICALLAAFAAAQTIHGRGGIRLPAPPPVKKTPVTDDYFGTKITDDYRWLEDAKSPETRAFINDENSYTQRYLEQARIRPQIAGDLQNLEQVSTWTRPIQRGEDLFFTRRLSGEDQASIYVRQGWAGKDKRLIDPAQLSRNPNTSVELMDVSRDATLIAYGVREGGEDETTIHVYNIKTGKTLFDTLPRGIYWSLNFAPDGKGIYYSRTSQKGSLVFLHILGTFSEEPDTLVFGHQFRGQDLGPNDLIESTVSDDGRYLVVTVEHGVPPTEEDIVYRDLTKPHSYFEVLTWGVQSRFSAIEDHGAWYVKTDYKAPNSCIMRADPGIMPDAWDMIVRAGPDPITDFRIVGGKLYVQRLRDVKPETAIYSLQGKLLGMLPLDGIGSVSTLRGRTTDRYGFYSFQSFIVPPIIYRLDTLTGKREVFAQTKVPFDSSQYQLIQVFLKSKDGTRIPMFIAGKKGLKQDGTARLLMTGYGGFNLSELPVWNPMFAWWIEQGGWFALPNLRGGGEYGQQWHHAGMFAKKQNVFDDFYAAAEYLIANKYTSPQHFAIYGRSNGGLLTGAAMTQRPDLFSAVVCGYPLLDMLRYQKFEQGQHWVTEYGSSENEQQFKYLLKYSPYQNVKPGTRYPAVMFFTGDDDTRVDPLHARKMTAIMQADSASGRPVLLHYGLNNGHSSGVSIEQKIQDDTDRLTFLWTETGAPTPQK